MRLTTYVLFGMDGTNMGTVTDYQEAKNWCEENGGTYNIRLTDYTPWDEVQGRIVHEKWKAEMKKKRAAK